MIQDIAREYVSNPRDLLLFFFSFYNISCSTISDRYVLKLNLFDHIQN